MIFVRVTLPLLMPIRGRTTRLILDALRALSDGYHVVVIAHPAAEAFRIVDETSLRAAEMGIPCAVSERNEVDFMSDVPLLYTRPFTWEPMIVRRNDPRPKILVDHSAVFERSSGTGRAAVHEVVTQKSRDEPWNAGRSWWSS